MLKIKDNIDLKELEKFGFELNMANQYVKTRLIDGEYTYKIYITPTHHYIQMIFYQSCTIAKSIQETLFDLIQAGLVEKVSDE